MRMIFAFEQLAFIARGGALHTAFGRCEASLQAWIVARFPRVAMLGLGCFCRGKAPSKTIPISFGTKNYDWPNL